MGPTIPPERQHALAAIARAQVERERRDAYANSWANWRPLNPCCATHVTVAWKGAADA